MLSVVFIFPLIASSAVVAQTLTGQYSCATKGDYQVCQNLWGESSGTGKQTSNLISVNGGGVSWETNWSWANGQNDVKSYANAMSNTAKGVQLSHISTVPTYWSWTYKSQANVRADVAYDIWLGSASSGSPATSASSYEIMVWLSAKGGVQPIGSVVNSGINIGGVTWNLWSGTNSNWHVYSFVATREVTDYIGDLNLFFAYLTANKGVSSAQYVHAIQAGTEPFTGSGDLLTKGYTVSITKK